MDIVFVFSRPNMYAPKGNKEESDMQSKNYSEILKELAEENIFGSNLEASQSEIDDYNRKEELEAMYQRF